MVLTPEELEERIFDLEKQVVKLKRRTRTDHRVPSLADEFDIEDAVFPPCVSLYASGVQSINNGAVTSLWWDREYADTDDMHHVSINNTRITFKTAGTYLVCASASWATRAAGRRLLRLVPNGVLNNAVAASEIGSVADAATEPGQNVAAIVPFVVGEYMEAWVYQDSGAALLVQQGRASFGAVRLGS